jgi:type II secretory pathway component GspD/PulD (secretin)
MNLSGPLPQVVEKICNAARVFCAYRHGSLKLQEKDIFIVDLPPVAKVAASGGTGAASASVSAASTNSMADTIAKMIGSKVQIDEQGGNIIYTATVDGENSIEKYLEELRNGRPLVVLQLYIWEVTLNKENAEGINWNELSLSGIGPGFAKLALSSASSFSGPVDAGSIAADTLTSGGVSLGAVTTGRLNTNSLVSFLSTQGRLQTISNPQMTFVSGSSAQLKVGGQQTYISQVGQLVSETNVSGTGTTSPTTGVGTNTVNTSTINTGLTVNVNGAYENGVVFANLDISLTDLVGLNPTTTGGETIDLPQTTDEKIDTSIRVRPGDNLVMAGLVTSADTDTRQGIPLPDDGRLPTYGDDQYQNHELVVVIKPSVVLFTDKLDAAREKAKEANRSLPDAIVIDKDGTKTLALPSPQNVLPSPLPPQAKAVPSLPAAKPELMVSEPNLTPTAPVAPSADGAPVNKSLMQGGFSHAFDELLGSDSSDVEANNNEAKP